MPTSCNRVEITKDPVKELIQQAQKEPLFTILLFDMDKEGIFSKVYKHRYRIIKEENGKVVAKDTKWYNVPVSYFQQNGNNLGMEVAAKDSSQKVSRVVGPPGYTNYIGNPKYGYWSDGQLITTSPEQKPTAAFSTMVKDSVGYHSSSNPATDFWHFYPAYSNVRTLLQLPAGKIYQKEHKEARSHYYRGFIYYGIITSSGRRRYGTYSNHYRLNNYGKKWSRGGGGYGK